MFQSGYVRRAWNSSTCMRYHSVWRTFIACACLRNRMHPGLLRGCRPTPACHRPAHKVLCRGDVGLRCRPSVGWNTPRGPAYCITEHVVHFVDRPQNGWRLTRLFFFAPPPFQRKNPAVATLFDVLPSPTQSYFISYGDKSPSPTALGGYVQTASVPTTSAVIDSWTPAEEGGQAEE